jgi:hypothetical protein
METFRGLIHRRRLGTLQNPGKEKGRWVNQGSRWMGRPERKRERGTGEHDGRNSHEEVRIL